MKIIALNIDQQTKPNVLAMTLRTKNLQQGDILQINSTIDKDLVMMIIVCVLISFYNKKAEYADNLLNEIFANKHSTDIEKIIARDYGIDVEITTTHEETQWQQFSKANLSKAYGEDEPEYSADMVLEPNPDYKK